MYIFNVSNLVHIKLFLDKLDEYREARAYEPMINLLLNSGASALAHQPEAGSALQYASRHCSPSVLQTLLDHGATISVGPGETPCLLSAATVCRNINVRLLLTHRARPDERDARGRTALIAAAESLWPEFRTQGSQPDTIAALLEAHADVNATDNNGVTALMLASVYHRTEIVKTLLAHGADACIRDKGRTQFIEGPECIAMLEPTKIGRTALDYGAGCAPIERLLKHASQARLAGDGLHR